MRYGSLVIDEIATETAPIAERIIDAGAVVHARTSTPEFSCAGFTHSKLWGITRNPWNPEVAVGGSSGGAGASLASGTSTLASGSDIGGSIRIPASINGVVGFKPPHGRVPTGPPFNLDRYCHDGPLARTVADVRAVRERARRPAPARRDVAATQARDPRAARGRRGAARRALHRPGGVGRRRRGRRQHARRGEGARGGRRRVDEVEVPWTMAQLTATGRRHFAAIFGALDRRDRPRVPR